MTNKEMAGARVGVHSLPFSRDCQSVSHTLQLRSSQCGASLSVQSLSSLGAIWDAGLQGLQPVLHIMMKKIRIHTKTFLEKVKGYRRQTAKIVKLLAPY